MEPTCWRELLSEAFKAHQDEWENVESISISDPAGNIISVFGLVMGISLFEAELDRMFDSDFGATEGLPFTVWTERRVYFPWNYDGREGVASVSRHPDGKPTDHIGGG